PAGHSGRGFDWAANSHHKRVPRKSNGTIWYYGETCRKPPPIATEVLGSRLLRFDRSPSLLLSSRNTPAGSSTHRSLRFDHPVAGGACLAEDLSRMEQVVQSYVSEKEFMGSGGRAF